MFLEGRGCAAWKSAKLAGQFKQFEHVDSKGFVFALPSVKLMCISRSCCAASPHRTVLLSVFEIKLMAHFVDLERINTPEFRGDITFSWLTEIKCMQERIPEMFLCQWVSKRTVSSFFPEELSPPIAWYLVFMWTFANGLDCRRLKKYFVPKAENAPNASLMQYN